MDGVQKQKDLTSAFVALADTLVADYDVVDLLQQLVERAVHLLDVTAAGLLLADAGGGLQLAASSSEEVRLLELHQLQADDGPCLECFSTGGRVAPGGPGEVARRWPVVAAAMRSAGFAGVAAVPLRLRAETIGALGLFTAGPGTPSEGDLDVAQGLADVATIGVLQARAVSDARAVAVQLQGALDSRVLIEQAKGVLAVQAGTSVSEAFQVLRGYARRRGAPLSAVAQQVVVGELDAERMAQAASARGHR